MKIVIFLLLLAFPLLGEEPFEFPASSKERKALLEILRPEIARQAGIKPEELKFDGSVKVQGKWAFFVGRSLNLESKSLALEPYGNDNTCALYLETKKGWVLVDWSAGYTDLFYADWASSYGLGADLLGLPEYLNPE